MGILLIIPESDELMSAAAAYVLHKCREKYGEDEAQCLMHSYPRRQGELLGTKNKQKGISEVCVAFSIDVVCSWSLDFSICRYSRLMK